MFRPIDCVQTNVQPGFRSVSLRSCSPVRSLSAPALGSDWSLYVGSKEEDREKATVWTAEFLLER